MEKWINELYNEALKKQSALGYTDGMAIFYSPVVYKPKLLLIGDNPGGTRGIVWESPPPQHDYFLNEKDDYRLAKKMRLIFSGNKLDKILRESVKINRVFFQSKNIHNIRNDWHTLEKFCIPHVQRIIKNIEPEIILTESFGTFNSIIQNNMGIINQEPLVQDKGRILLQSGIIEGKVILGIQHPTGSRGISNEQWKLVSNKLNEIL